MSDEPSVSASASTSAAAAAAALLSPSTRLSTKLELPGGFVPRRKPSRPLSPSGKVDETAPIVEDQPPRIDTEEYPLPFGLLEWVDKNKDLLKPPVNNKSLFGLNAQYIVMIIGGPNTRTDFHVNMTEEFFFQIKGSMLLKIVNDTGLIEDIIINEGEVFLLPANVPHSPRRFPDTIGLVIEKKRKPEELDKVQWYCRHCSSLIYEGTFHCSNIDTELAEKLVLYTKSAEFRTCKTCSKVDEIAGALSDIKDALEPKDRPKTSGSSSPGIDFRVFPKPFLLKEWIAENASEIGPPICSKALFPHSQWRIVVEGGPHSRSDYQIIPADIWFYQIKGDITLKLVVEGEFKELELSEGSTFLLPARIPFSLQRHSKSVCLRVARVLDGEELSVLRWYCTHCKAVVLEQTYRRDDRTSVFQIDALIREYSEHPELRECLECGRTNALPVDRLASPPPPLLSPKSLSRS